MYPAQGLEEGDGLVSGLGVEGVGEDLVFESIVEEAVGLVGVEVEFGVGVEGGHLVAELFGGGDGDEVIGGAEEGDGGGHVGVEVVEG